MQVGEEPVDEENHDMFTQNKKPKTDDSPPRRTNLLSDMRKRKDDKTQADKLPKNIKTDKVYYPHENIPLSPSVKMNIPGDTENPALPSGSASSAFPGVSIPAQHDFCPSSSVNPGMPIPPAMDYPAVGHAERPHYSEHPA
eukprot:15545708-Heterocapsa_arctica.AAC.1